MINLKDIGYQPSLEEIKEFTGNSLFSDLCLKLEKDYSAVPKIEFSKCSWENGWNVKFKKSGKTLCTVYPREHYFTVMVVIGAKERDKVEKLLPEFTDTICEIYQQTKEGNGQKWLMIDLEDPGAEYDAVLKLIQIRYDCK